MEEGLWGPSWVPFKNKNMGDPIIMHTWTQHPSKTPVTLDSNKEKKESIKNAILAAVRVTDANLINMENRLRKRATSKRGEVRIILQSEALSIFRGHLFKMFKQVMDSYESNRVKRLLSIELNLGTDKCDYPEANTIIEGVKFHWLFPESYESKQLKVTKGYIEEARLELRDADVVCEGRAALADYYDKNPAEKVVTNVKQVIDYQRLNNIKF